MPDGHSILYPRASLNNLHLITCVIQCRRCDPVWDNVTWPRITLQKTHWFLLRSCPGINALGKIVTEINVLFVTLQIIHYFLLRSCPDRQDRNNNTCIFCNVTNNTLISVTILPRAYMPGQDRNKNQCVFCNAILGQVTLSPTGSHLLHT